MRDGAAPKQTAHVDRRAETKGVGIQNGEVTTTDMQRLKLTGWTRDPCVFLVDLGAWSSPRSTEHGGDGALYAMAKNALARFGQHVIPVGSITLLIIHSVNTCRQLLERILVVKMLFSVYSSSMKQETPVRGVIPSCSRTSLIS